MNSDLSKIINGITINKFNIYAKTVRKGRYSEEINLDIYLRIDQFEQFLLSVKIFHGRKPYYKPWIEIFNINNEINMNNKLLIYFDSNLENTILSFFSQLFEHGENIYVEYYNDTETKKQLEANIPPAISRLGYKLFTLGFTWFKDWYFPEGFMEGNMKLQGEKPLNNTLKIEQLRKIHKEIKTFLINTKDNEWYIIKAKERAKILISSLKTTSLLF